jgi:hypothetical protein
MGGVPESSMEDVELVLALEEYPGGFRYHAR